MRRFRYRLVDAVDRRELGWFMSSRDDWRPGDVIGSTDKPSRVVLAVFEPENDVDFHAYLTVVSVAELGVDDLAPSTGGAASLGGAGSSAGKNAATPAATQS